MLRNILVVSSAIFLYSSGAFTQATTTTRTPSPTQSISFQTSTQKPAASEPDLVVFWEKNWQWFLIGFLGVAIPIIVWAILGPGKRWYKARRNKSRPITWDMIGNERFHNQPMREVNIRRFSRSRGSGSSTSSHLALSLNAAAPGERDIEAAAEIASPKSPSTYIERERMMRNDSSEAVIGLVQPQRLMPPRTRPADRGSNGSLGPPDPSIHRAHPRYNYFQRYSRQHQRRYVHETVPPAHVQQNSGPPPTNQEGLEESMQLLLTQIPNRKPLRRMTGTIQRDSVSNTAGTQRIFLPQPPRSTPYHIRQGSYEGIHIRSTSWHNTTHRGSVQTNPYPSRHASMDGYPPVFGSVPSLPLPEPAVTYPQTHSQPRRSTSRGRLQKPQHLNPRSSSHVQQTPRPSETQGEQPQMSFYRTPQPSRESLARSVAPSTSSAPPVPPVQRAAYPTRSAMSSRSAAQPRVDAVHGTETGYSYSISGGSPPINPPAKSVKFAAIAPTSSGVPGRFPVQHF
ncbi:hypothetical protein H072_3797 [Dactylellina haptotyla CBS 200.50]|uniref:Uncharacterized protein n=1 Tax=Dactylellina haptotyla (strain CBS 200.50) TaxID=1284197 RepID=S8AHB4_DACHA|nr:hypothetical protein H072_3797 [Dactylellina haptotyla CBS 200.50]